MLFPLLNSTLIYAFEMMDKELVKRINNYCSNRAIVSASFKKYFKLELKKPQVLYCLVYYLCVENNYKEVSMVLNQIGGQLELMKEFIIDNIKDSFNTMITLEWQLAFYKGGVMSTVGTYYLIYLMKNELINLINTRENNKTLLFSFIKEIGTFLYDIKTNMVQLLPFLFLASEAHFKKGIYDKEILEYCYFYQLASKIEDVGIMDDLMANYLNSFIGFNEDNPGVHQLCSIIFPFIEGYDSKIFITENAAFKVLLFSSQEVEVPAKLLKKYINFLKKEVNKSPFYQKIEKEDKKNFCFCPF